MAIELSNELKKEWAGKDPFEVVEAIEGTIFKQKDNRRTLRFELAGKNYFAKVHHGVGWREIFKNLFSLKAPVVSAATEWHAIKRFEELGVKTLHAEGYGVRGVSPAKLDSFLITRELADTITLEELTSHWKDHPPAFSLKKALIEKLAEISRTLHDNGVNHRDYYLCHFLLKIHNPQETPDPADLTIYVVDLHRVQTHKGSLPSRWRVKDLGALFYSSIPAGLTRRDVYRFIKAYTGQPLREALSDHKTLWTKVWERTKKFYKEAYGKPAPKLFLT